MNTIARCAFGIDVDCQRNQDQPIAKHGREIFASFRVKNWLETIILQCFFYFPGIEKLISLWPPAAEKIRNMSLDIIKQREENNIKSNDFLGRLQDLIAAKQSGKSDEDLDVLSPELITAQAIVFFAAGFETTANCLSTTSYYLAKNPEVKDIILQVFLKYITLNLTCF